MQAVTATLADAKETGLDARVACLIKIRLHFHIKRGAKSTSESFSLRATYLCFCSDWPWQEFI